MNNFKRNLFLLALVLLLVITPALSQAQASPLENLGEAITLTLGSNLVSRGSSVLEAPTVAPQIINGRTMLPFRYLVQTVLGGEVDYQADTRKITAKVSGHDIIMIIDQLLILVDDVANDYGQAPIIVEGSTLVPLRAFEQVLDDLRWDAATQTVTLIPLGNTSSTLTTQTTPAAVQEPPTVAANIAPTAIDLSSTEIIIDVKNTATLTASVTPTDAENENITWTSSHPGIATVSDSGLVTGVVVGKATIMAKTKNGLTATCAVEVKQPVTVTGISLPSRSEKLKIGESKTLIASISPSDADDKTLSWISSHSNIVSVSSSGQIRGVAKGSATITAQATNGVTVTCEITVVDGNSVDISLPRYPVSLNHLDRDGLVESVVEITNITVDQTYYQHSNSVTAKIQFEGKLISAKRSGQTYGYIEWQLIDSEGFIIDSGDRMTNRLSVGSAFRGVEATIFDLVPGKNYTLELISGEGLSQEETTANLILPSLPVQITEHNSTGTKTLSNITVTDIRVEQEYRGSRATATVNLYFSGKCNAVFENTNTNRKIIWTLKDAQGNTVDSGQAYTPILKDGDTFVDADSTIYNLRVGQTYYLNLSGSVK